jgi:hypothetical protein
VVVIVKQNICWKPQWQWQRSIDKHWQESAFHHRILINNVGKSCPEVYCAAKLTIMFFSDGFRVNAA